ncbi:Hypothetical predicted protein [Paramuricea clavata]|uniref:Uncharacterized protein n=2 Tax=Paramuricea clavata TaxID=317549 RepID=A0A7D9HXJ6_PARCT|nr:Hypothetical predicted protein [Paramuricea clavata]
MRLHTILGFVLLLLSTLQQSEGKAGNRVLENFREYMSGEATPAPRPDEVQVSPPKVWRRKRDTKIQNYNSVEDLVLDAETAKDFAGRIDGAVR